MVETAKPISDFGTGDGRSTTLTRIRNVTESAVITINETQRIPEANYEVSVTNIHALEVGRAIPFTSLSKDFSHYDLGSSVQYKLMEVMKLGMDTMCSEAYKDASIKYAITGLSSNNITTNGVFGATSTDTLNLYHVEQIADYLYDTVKCPPFMDEHYCGVFRTKSIRGLRDDPAFQAWEQYTTPRGRMRGEAGLMEPIRLKQTNHEQAWGNVGANGVLGEGVVFGADAVAMVEVRTPTLIMSQGDADNAYRNKSAVWYGIINFAIIWPTGNAGEARVVHVGSL